MRKSFVIGDYRYSRGGTWAGTGNAYPSWAKDATKTFTFTGMTGYDRVTDEDEETLQVIISSYASSPTINDEIYYFMRGVSKTYNSSNFTVTYGGASSVTIKAKKALATIYVDYSEYLYVTGQVSAEADDRTKSSYADMPSTVTDEGTSSNVVSCYRAFENCVNLVTAPQIPNTVTSMVEAFNGCSALITAPAIPSSVKYMMGAFDSCASLTGNIEVYSDSPSSDMFAGTQHDIFIIDKGSAFPANWKGVARLYTNIHFEADDNPAPVVSNLTATRVSSPSSTTFAPTGLYAYIQARIMVYDNLIPDGWTNEVKSATLTDNGATETPTWQPQPWAPTEYPADAYCWIYLGDTSTHTLTLQISDSVKDAGTEVVSKTSAVLSKVLSKSYALVDYYHDDTTDTEGMSIGKYAEQADLFDVDMPARFRQGVTTDEGVVVGEDVVVGEHALFNLDNPIETAPIQIKQSDIDSEGSAPSGNTYGGSLFIYDDSGKRIGYIESAHFTDGNISNRFGASREVNGSMVYNTIGVEVASDGTLEYGVTDKAAFRKAIGLNITTETKQSLNNTISAGGTKQITFDLTSSGKTPIAIKGYNINNSSSGGQGVSLQNVYGCYISGNTGTVEIRNTWTSQAKVDVYLYVLYMGS